MQRVDVIVLGAGIVGVSTALHLRRRGMTVALFDQSFPGEGASSGNGGLIASNGFCPPMLPRFSAELLDIFLKQSAAVQYDFKTLIGLVPWLRKYVAESGGDQANEYARAIAPLKALALGEHHRLAKNTTAERFYRKLGWLQLFRSEASYVRAERERHYARIYGINYREVSGGELTALEPGLRADMVRGVLWPESESVSNPAGVVESLWRAFVHEGGIYLDADARDLDARRNAWRLRCKRGNQLQSTHLVVALGAWSAEFAESLGETFPMASFRGYCQQYRARSGASLSRPISDVDNGYMLSPMEKGIRLTTGFEVADLDSRPNPVQLTIAERRAKHIFPLGHTLPDMDWIGARSFLTDALPVIGASVSQPGLWYNFGHGMDGFALGPLSGRLIADMITGRDIAFDTSAVSPTRFLV